MRILWDFRLFSFGYANRGVGIFTQNLASAIIREQKDNCIFIWADKKSLPSFMKAWPVKWINYKPSSWKKDLITIPFIILKYRISIMHYWISLGPIHSIGMGLFHPCKVVTTIYDLGVELWHSVPFAKSKRNTWYWKIQKKLIQQSTNAICISEATKSDLIYNLKRVKFPIKVIYCPLIDDIYTKIEKRKKYFITLGGSIHKNLKRIIYAFSIVHKKYPKFKLVILGDIQKDEELPDNIPEFIYFEDMSFYTYHKQHASGLIFCSLYEGLGLPVIEAMDFNCPLILSDIPSLREICSDAASYVDPEDISDIASGIIKIISNQKFWMKKSMQQKFKYMELSKNSGYDILKLYNSLIR